MGPWQPLEVGLRPSHSLIFVKHHFGWTAEPPEGRREIGQQQSADEDGVDLRPLKRAGSRQGSNPRFQFHGRLNTR